MKRNKPDGEDAASGEGETKAAIIDGKAMAATIRGEIAVEVKQLTEKLGRAPGLAVVIVGERKDSQTYVRNKVSASRVVRRLAGHVFPDVYPFLAGQGMRGVRDSVAEDRAARERVRGGGLLPACLLLHLPAHSTASVFLLARMHDGRGSSCSA
eukprot:497504-Rhodomonas_salina.1